MVRNALAACIAAIMATGCSTGHPHRATAPTAPTGPAATSAPSDPCKLVTKAEAEAALGVTLGAPKVGPQGPTCIFAGTDGTVAATVALESRPYSQFQAAIQSPETSTIDGFATVCGNFGQSTLAAQVASGSTLVVAAPCAAAQKLAAAALPRVSKP